MSIILWLTSVYWTFYLISIWFFVASQKINTLKISTLIIKIILSGTNEYHYEEYF